MASYTYSQHMRSLRHASLAVFLAAFLLAFTYVDSPHPAVVDAGVIHQPRQAGSICKRWAQQSAVINGTVYLYGGQASTSPDQGIANTWNNDFLSLDLTKSWQISSPSLNTLPHPSGAPAVSLGALWASQDTLYLYGGEFSSSPPTDPDPFVLWEYETPTSTWTYQPTPSATAAGDGYSNAGGLVQRAAEGAGTSSVGIGRGWYFGGHLDGYTVAGWSQSVPRVYLKTLLEYTFPGYPDPTANNAPAPATGTFRNISTSSSDSSGFPERADGVLIYIPNIGSQGILVGLAGGTADTFTQMNIIDIFDISSSTWYKQSTAGPTPPIRVNPCAVGAVAPDGSSINIHMYGGQNLQPARQQIQYDDLWILTVPSFTWIQVDMSDQSVPSARAGHSCNVWDGQMVVVGGYVGQELSCDSPGTYVFNLSSLAWAQSFNAMSDPTSNPQSKQAAQIHDPSALSGSYGYSVPDVVQHNIGGNAQGGATVTVPVALATSGPLASGTPKTYVVTATATTTASAGNGSKSSGGLSTGADVAIAVGIVGCVLLVLAAYLAYCAYLYRKRMRLYQWNMQAAHTALTEQRLSFDERAGVSATDYFGSATTGTSPGSGYTSASAAAASADKEKQKQEGQPQPQGRTGTHRSSEDLLRGQEPSFVGIMLHPRRSLRVVNRD